MNPISNKKLIAVVAELANVPETDLQHDTPLITSGLLDSFAMLELITKLEKYIHIVIRPSEIHLENLDSLEKLRRFLTRLGAYAVT